MKILIATPLYPPEVGGPSYYASGLVEGLTQCGYDVSVAPFASVRRYPTGIRHLVYFFKTLKEARGATAVIVLDTMSVALPAVLAGWLTKTPTIIRTGGDFVWEQYVAQGRGTPLLSEFYTLPTLNLRSRFLIWIQRRIIFPLTTHIVFSTEWQKKLWHVPYNIPEEKSSVIANQCVIEHRAQTDDSKTLDTFVFAGRDTPLKNVPMLREAFEITKEQYPWAKLEILSGLPQNVLKAKMQQARCVVLPSLSDISPNIVFEAIALGHRHPQ